MTQLNALSVSNRLIMGLWIVLVAILPLEHVPALRLTLLVVLFVWLFASAPTGMFAGYKLAMPLLAWAAFCAASWFWSIRPQSTLYHLKADLLPSLVAFAIFFRIAQKDWATTGLSLAMLCCSLVNGLVALLGHLANIDWFEYLYADVGYSSSIAVVTLAYAVAQLLYAPGDKPAWTILACSLLAGMISANRMFALIAAPLLLVLCLQLAVYRRRFLPVLLFAAVLVVVSTVALTQESALPAIGVLQAKFKTWHTLKDPRFSIWTSWIGFANLHPWFGIGYGRSVGQYTFGAEFSEELMKIDAYSVMHSHNLFINSYVETGSIGLLLFVLLWGFIILRFGKAALRRVDAMAGLLIVLAFLAKNVTDIFFLKSTIVLVVGLIGFFLARTRDQSVSS